MFVERGITLTDCRETAGEPDASASGYSARQYAVGPKTGATIRFDETGGSRLPLATIRKNPVLQCVAGKDVLAQYPNR